ncbi:MAG: glycosyltransferase [Alistipes sp.]|nr:glycosyltransferase [Alistipes sp.]
MSIPKISVIVPIYKAEKYLRRCVDSILAQTFADFEVLLVDDGSPDRSGKICDEYAAMDSRVRVFHKENAGVSCARNLGIEKACGEYTIHADPDDWIEPSMLAELYSKAKSDDADMVICDFYVEYESKQNYKEQRPLSLENEKILKQVLDGSIHGALWNKIIKRNCYIANNICIPPEMSLWEDRYVVTRLLMSDIKVAYLNSAFYHYDSYSNSNSIVRSTSLKSLNSQIYFIDYFEKCLDVNKYSREFYLMKSCTKDRAFLCPEYSSSQFRNLYKEINNRYVKFCNPVHFRFYPAISLLLRNKDLPYFLYKVLIQIKIVVKSI